MRPTYQTEKDLENERRVANLLAAKGYEFHKLPVQYRLDWLITEAGEPRGFGELKARNVMKDTYPTVMISLSKVMAADALTQTTGLPCYLLLLYRDCLARLRFDEDFTLGVGGRTDRGDHQDVEACAFFPKERLTVVSQFATE